VCRVFDVYDEKQFQFCDVVVVYTYYSLSDTHLFIIGKLAFES
jgi:hypothetical protein